MMGWAHHLIVAPILLPLVMSAMMLFFDERRRRLKRVLSMATAIALVAISLVLLHSAWEEKEVAAQAYLLGNWPAPFGIVLVADRLSALMLVLTNLLGFASLFYALARWDRSGPRFHALFLLLLMGFNGAFLTGDIFNLFVFFEVFLAASYGLVLHGSNVERARAGLHFITINIATSLLFLIGVAMIYAVTGTLNMADLAYRIPSVPAEDVMLLESGAAILGIAFLLKAGIWPLNFWLPKTYSVVAPPVAAIFAIMSKVGIYIILRLASILFGDEAGSTANFANEWMIYAGMATIIFGIVGILATKNLMRLVSYYVPVSSGMLLAAFATNNSTVVTAALFYLISSTLTVSAFYLIIEAIERNADTEHEAPALQSGAAVFDDEYLGALEEEEDETGVAIPATIALLGGAFIFCVLLLSGMPPLSGFIAKFAIIDGLFQMDGGISASTWVLTGLIIVSGLAVLLTATRAGIDLLWTPSDKPQARLSVIEAIPAGLLLAICVALTIKAGSVMIYLEQTVQDLRTPALYIDAVFNAPRAGHGEVAP